MLSTARATTRPKPLAGSGRNVEDDEGRFKFDRLHHDDSQDLLAASR